MEECLSFSTSIPQNNLQNSIDSDNEADHIAPLFDDLNFKDKFIPPTNKEVIDWLKQTQGILSNDLRLLLGLPILKERERIKYSGLLSLRQQIYIYRELNE